MSQHKGASLEAIQDHYDLSNRFYGLWLDERMNYSGALYETGEESLETAQLKKLDYHLREARVAPDSRLLDIGCGWGALVGRALERFAAREATGLTLSQAQADYIKAKRNDRIKVRVENWQDHKPAEPYDAIVSIGAFEHFAQIEYSEAEKVEAYRAFFRRCQNDFLKHGGYISLQTFAYGSVRNRQDALGESATRFLAEEIFRETDPPHLSNVIEAIQSSFEIVALRNDRLHYAKTLREWMDRLKRNRGAAVKEVGEDEVLRYEKYLQYSYLGFQSGRLDLYRITLKRLSTPWRGKVVSSA